MSEIAIDARPASPLGGPPLPSADGVARLVEAEASARLVLRAGSEAAGRIGATLGLDLTSRINRAARSESCSALRLGPDEWLLIADAEADPWLAARIREAAADLAVSVVDVSHRHAGLVLDGPAVEAVLAAGCPLPLDAAVFPMERATRTLFAKAEIVLWRRGPDRFHIEVARSFAPYVAALLAEVIANERALGVPLR